MGKRLKRKNAAPTPTADLPCSPGRWRRQLAIWSLVGIGAVLGAVWAMGREAQLFVYGYEVVNVFPHDVHAYSQGLAFDEGVLYEGTGLHGQSTLRKIELETGRILQQVKLENRYFGEGITVFEDQVLQLTWRSEVGFVYDKQSLELQSRFRYAGQGWGLTHDGRHLIMSDGSATLRFLDPRTYRVVQRLNVRSQGRRIGHLNELEYIDGLIYANIWHSDHIACISPRTGEVAAWIDLRGLLPDHERPDEEAVLNGIAYDAENKRLFVTGKNWPKLFEIRLQRR